jgi:hypothetical protein
LRPDAGEAFPQKYQSNIERLPEKVRTWDLDYQKVQHFIIHHSSAILLEQPHRPSRFFAENGHIRQAPINGAEFCVIRIPQFGGRCVTTQASSSCHFAVIMA